MSSEQQTPHILIVDDSRTISVMLRNKITKVLGFKVTVAASLREAQAILEVDSEQFFLAVLDITLPDAPNGEIVDYVLKFGITSIVMTATFDDALRQSFSHKKIADYVLKESARDVDYIISLIKRINANRKLNLLIVDDSPTYRTVLQQYLSIHQYQILHANSGEEALEHFKNHDIRVMITDYQMPGMDGFELTSRVRKRYPKDKVVILGLSGQSENAGAVSAQFLKKGANDYLSKPFSKEELFCRLNQNLELIELIQEIRDIANKDYLSGLYNRRYFFDAGSHLYEHTLRKGLPLAIGMVDIDFFKKVNDTYGHDAGDTTIKHVANLLTDLVRKTDIVSRFGGEEFCLLMVDPDNASVERLFERIRETIATVPVIHGKLEFYITVSIGVACYTSESSMEQLINRADGLLYEAKEGGRNRVVLSS